MPTTPYNAPPKHGSQSGTSPSGDNLKDKLRDTRDAASEAASETAADFRGTVSKGVSQAREVAEEKSEAAKSDIAGEMERTAKALDTAADELDGSSMQQDLLREAASGLSEVANSMHGKSVGVIAEDLSDFGRRNPAAFLGAAALAGFALGRFARASTSSDAHVASTQYGGADAPGS